MLKIKNKKEFKLNNIENSYIQTLENIKSAIRTAQIKASLAVNSELVILYWNIGKIILQQQKEQGWGAKVIENISKDLQNSFPNMKGLSYRNLNYMRKFAETYSDFEFVQQLVAQLPWGQNIWLMDKLETEEKRSWYAQKALENGWSRNVLAMQIESNLYERQNSENKVNNFALTLPKPQSDLANELLKDQYVFDFLEISEQAKEREVEQGLVKNLKKFLLELGKGFAFVGEQYHLSVSNQDYYLDLLFYHTKLHAYVVFELKIGEFLPEYAGKMNFYLNAVDEQVKTKEDNASIGVILCKSKDKIIAEYSIKDMTKPIGIAEYTLTNSIPDNIKDNMPTIEEYSTLIQHFDTFFEPLWKNRNRVPLQVSNLQEDIDFLNEYYKNTEIFKYYFNKDILLDYGVKEEIQNLKNNNIRIDTDKCIIEYPIGYIKNNIQDYEINALKYHFKDIESRFKDNTLYKENEFLFERFKKEYKL